MHIDKNKCTMYIILFLFFLLLFIKNNIYMLFSVNFFLFFFARSLLLVQVTYICVCWWCLFSYNIHTYREEKDFLYLKEKKLRFNQVIRLSLSSQSTRVVGTGDSSGWLREIFSKNHTNNFKWRVCFFSLSLIEI